GDVESAGVQRANLPGGQGFAGGGVAQFVEVAVGGVFDQVLGVSEEVDDGHDPDAVAGGGGDELFEFAPSVGGGAGDAGERGIIHGVLRVQVELLVAPLGVAGEEGEEDGQAFDLAGEVPLKGAEHWAEVNEECPMSNAECVTSD